MRLKSEVIFASEWRYARCRGTGTACEYARPVGIYAVAEFHDFTKEDESLPIPHRSVDYWGQGFKGSRPSAFVCVPWMPEQMSRRDYQAISL